MEQFLNSGVQVWHIVIVCIALMFWFESRMNIKEMEQEDDFKKLEELYNSKDNYKDYYENEFNSIHNSLNRLVKEQLDLDNQHDLTKETIERFLPNFFKVFKLLQSLRGVSGTYKGKAHFIVKEDEWLTQKQIDDRIDQLTGNAQKNGRDKNV